MSKLVCEKKFSDSVKILLIAVFASQIGLAPVATLPAQANYTSWNTNSIVYNDGVCNLGNPANHLSEESALEISSADELWEITDCVSTSARVYFKLANDIDVTAASFAPTASPIGLSTSGVIPFSGTLIGGTGSEKKTIRGVDMNSSTHGVGLFALLDGAHLKSLHLQGEIITAAGSGEEEDAAGGIAVRSEGGLVLEYVTSEMTVSGAYYVGGLVGHVSGSAQLTETGHFGQIGGWGTVGGLLGQVDHATITGALKTGIVVTVESEGGGLVGSAASLSVVESINGATITGVDASTDTLGGLVGRVRTGLLEIEDSQNQGNIQTFDQYGGGFVGNARAGVSVTSSANLGNISGGSRLGGLAGMVSGSSNIDSFLNAGDIGGADAIGGIIGRVESGDARVAQATNTGDLTSSNSNVGGLIGRSATGEVVAISVSNRGEIRGGSNAGGLLGSVGGFATIFGATNSGLVEGGEFVGGIAGFLESGADLSEVSNQSRVTASSNKVGGLVGELRGTSSITKSSNVAEIETSAGNTAGGLFGNLLTQNISVASSFNSGNVRSMQWTGGIAGYLNNSGHASFNEVYNSGRVRSIDAPGGKWAGGLFGYANINNGSLLVQAAYNSGEIFAEDDHAGGLAGYVLGSGAAELYQFFNSGEVSSGGNSDGLVTVGDLSASAIVTSANSSFTSTATTQSLQIASTFAGFDFKNTWGFGTCEQEQGQPLLRVFNQVETFYEDGCFTPSVQSDSDQQEPVAPVYLGPIVERVEKDEETSRLMVRGSRLDFVTSVEIAGTDLEIASRTKDILILEFPGAMDPGVYDLVASSQFGTLTVQAAVKIQQEESPSLELSNQEQVITVASFKGVVAIYTKGYEGQRLSARIAGKWMVVPTIDESWKGLALSRTIRRVAVGREIQVALYIDRKLLRIEEILTR